MLLNGSASRVRCEILDDSTFRPVVRWLRALSSVGLEDRSRRARLFATTNAPRKKNHSRVFTEGGGGDGSNALSGDPRIFPDSLRATLDAHREANRSSLIHKVQQEDPVKDARHAIYKPKIPYTKSAQRADAHVEDDADRVAKGVGMKATRRKKGPWSKGDYKGQYQAAQNEWKLTPDLKTNRCKPWLSRLPGDQAKQALSSLTAGERLTAEIRAFQNYMTPTSDESAASDHAVKDVESAMTSLGRDMTVEVVGSRSTGLDMPNSDIDFNICSPNLPKEREAFTRGPSPGRPEVRKVAEKHLREVANLMYRDKRFTIGAVIAARIPIVVATHNQTGLKLQFQCTIERAISEEYARYYQSEYPSLRALYYLVRMILEVRGLSETVNGGLGSYATSMMVVAALKIHEGTYDRKDFGNQYLQFLELFSTTDFYTTGLSVDPPEKFTKRPPKSSQTTEEKESTELYMRARKTLAQAKLDQPFLMCLQDPGNFANDLGAKSHRIKHIQVVFTEILRDLKSQMSNWEGKENKTDDSLLFKSVGANWSRFRDRRWTLSNSITYSVPG